MKVYLLMMVVAAAVTYLVTPVARWAALRTGAMTAVRDRDVHVVPTPRLGGVAMLFGVAASMVVASRTPFLEGVFAGSRAAWAVLAGAALVCLLGVADDIWDLDWITKLVGQVLAVGLMAWQGVQLITVPIGGLTIGSSRLSLVVTVFVVVLTMNAVNFVDGLDGLAAGIVAIGGSGFFVYTYLLTQQANQSDYSNLATAILASLVGVCVGFLPHNFHPARIFMGDSGSMLLGLLLSAATIVVTGQIDPEQVSGSKSFPAFLPILLPCAIIVLPLLDMVLAIVRRVGAGLSPFHADRMHLHHRLLALGHSHRRAVVIMYLWTALFAFSAVALVSQPVHRVLIGLAVGCVVAALLTLGPLRGRDTADPDTADPDTADRDAAAPDSADAGSPDPGTGDPSPTDPAPGLPESWGSRVT